MEEDYGSNKKDYNAQSESLILFGISAWNCASIVYQNTDIFYIFDKLGNAFTLA